MIESLIININSHFAMLSVIEVELKDKYQSSDFLNINVLTSVFMRDLNYE